MLGILPDNYPHDANPATAAKPGTAIGRGSHIPVFNGQIRTMLGETLHISLTENARPFCVTTPHTIPFAYRDKLKNEIDLLTSQGIIAPVTEPTEWCALIVVTLKNSDRIHMCVDLSKLNRFV